MKRKIYEDWHTALDEAAALPFAFIRCYSTLYIGPNTAAFDMQEMEEAHFFGDSCEIALFTEGDTITATKTEDEADGSSTLYLDAEESYPGHHAFVAKRQYVDFDIDGQAYISAVRMLSCREG